MGLLSRNKGKRWERVCAAKLREVFNLGPDDVHRGWQARDGADAPDVIGVPHLWCEAKHGKLVNLRAALKQAEAATAKNGKGLVPLVLAKDDRAEAVAMMRMDAFLAIVKEWWELRSSLRSSRPLDDMVEARTRIEALETERDLGKDAP